MSTATLKKPKLKIPDTLTGRQKHALRYMVEKGGSKAEALRAAGYSAAVIKNPKRVTQSKAFIKVLEKAGMTDSFLAQRHQELMDAAKIEFLDFPALKGSKTISVDEDGKKLKKPYKETVYRHTPDEEIRRQVESVPGVKLMYIQKGTYEKRAYIKVPENIVRKGALDMGYKVKDHFAADKLEIVEHELTEEEMAQLGQIFRE